MYADSRSAASVQECKAHGIMACTVCNPKAFGGTQDPHAAKARENPNWLWGVASGLLVNVAEAAMDYVDELTAEGVADITDLLTAVEALRDARW